MTYDDEPEDPKDDEDEDDEDDDDSSSRVLTGNWVHQSYAER